MRDFLYFLLSLSASSTACEGRALLVDFSYNKILTKKFKVMKLFIKIMNEDIQKEHFTVWEIVVSSIVIPLCFIGLMCLAGYLETLCD